MTSRWTRAAVMSHSPVDVHNPQTMLHTNTCEAPRGRAVSRKRRFRRPASKLAQPTNHRRSCILLEDHGNNVSILAGIGQSHAHGLTKRLHRLALPSFEHSSLVERLFGQFGEGAVFVGDLILVLARSGRLGRLSRFGGRERHNLAFGAAVVAIQAIRALWPSE